MSGLFISFWPSGEALIKIIKVSGGDEDSHLFHLRFPCGSLMFLPAETCADGYHVITHKQENMDTEVSLELLFNALIKGGGRI